MPIELNGQSTQCKYQCKFVCVFMCVDACTCMQIVCTRVCMFVGVGKLLLNSASPESSCVNVSFSKPCESYSMLDYCIMACPLAL